MPWMIELAFACIVAIGMPARAWYRRRLATPVRLDRYLLETLLLAGVLGWMLWRRGVPAHALGLAADSWRDFAFDLVVCLVVVVGPDAWAAWRITRAAPQPVAPAVPDPLLSDLAAGRHTTGWFVSGMVVGAVWEELCFRATFLLFVPRTPSGVVLGVAAGSLLFGAQHVRSGIRRAAYACGYGVMFSALYLITNNLVAVIAAHAAGNILSGLQWTPRLERVRQAAAPQSSIFIG